MNSQSHETLWFVFLCLGHYKVLWCDFRAIWFTERTFSWFQICRALQYDLLSYTPPFGTKDLLEQANPPHADVIKWKHFRRYLPSVRGIHRSPVNSPDKSQCGSLIFSLKCSWINVWVNNREAGDLIRHPAHYDVIVMIPVRAWISAPPLKSCDAIIFPCIRTRTRGDTVHVPIVSDTQKTLSFVTLVISICPP